VSEKTKAYRVLIGMPEGKRPLGRLRCRLKDDIKIDLREVRLGDTDCIHLVQNTDH
jgi:hypothetical protein